MYKNLNKQIRQDGFTLIELLIVVAVIGILVAVAVPGYIGMQERSRRGAVIKAASAVEPELQAWLHSALKGVAGIQASVIEVDSAAPFGEITAADANNNQLGVFLNAGTLDDNYALARQGIYTEMSPWDPVVSLFTSDAAAVSQIAVIQNAAGSVYSLQVVAQDKLGNELHNKILYAD